MRRFETESWGPTYEWNGLDEFRTIHHLPDGVHRVRFSAGGSPEGQVFLEFYARLVPDQPLAVHFYGAQRLPRRNSEAIFRGFRTSAELGSSYVLFHDPTLSLTTDIGLGWYEGFNGFSAAQAIQQVLHHIIDQSGSPRTILWGGSAGGYAALRHVGTLPDAAAFVWNPQTAITRYQKAPVRKYAQVGFGTDDLNEGVLDTPGVVTDLTRQPNPNWQDAPVVYLQEADDRHVRRHLSHLLTHLQPEAANEVCLRDTMFGLVGERFYLHLSHWEPGHTPPPKSVIVNFLKTLLDVSTPIAHAMANLEPASYELLRSSRSPNQRPLAFERTSPIRQPRDMKRVLQWGSRLGRATVASAVEKSPFLVTRSILGQSVITAYSIRSSSPPKTALDLARAESSEQRLTLLRDRRASASAALNDDPNLDYVVIDLLEEVRGTINVGSGFIVTNHGYLRRMDRGKTVEHEFGSDRHCALWSNRLERLSSAAEKSEVSIIVVDFDPRHLAKEDWDWLNIPEPTAEVLSKWPKMVRLARDILKNARWMIIGRPSSSAEEAATGAGAELATVIYERHS